MVAPKKGETGKIEAITVHRLEMETVEVPIKGVTPLITNPWTNKAKEMLRTSQGIGVEPGKPKNKKEAKNRGAEFEDRLNTYRLPNGDNGFPAVAFKAAMVRAAQVLLGIEMTKGRLMFHVSGVEDTDFVTLEGEPKIYENFPRNANGNPDIRYRPIFYEWATTLRVSFVKNLIDRQSIVNLVDHAGQMVGVGEWRPGSKTSNTGQYGRFGVVES